MIYITQTICSQTKPPKEPCEGGIERAGRYTLIGKTERPVSDSTEVRGKASTYLLSPCSGTSSTELLGLHPPGVGDQQRSVVGDQGLLQFESGSGILVLGVETKTWLDRDIRVKSMRLSERLTQRYPWRWPVGERRAAKRVHHPSLGVGCRCWRTSRHQRQGRARRPCIGAEHCRGQHSIRIQQMPVPSPSVSFQHIPFLSDRFRLGSHVRPAAVAVFQLFPD